MFAHVREVTQATALPLSVDLENGYGAEPERAASALLRVAEAGAVGGSIEDWDPETGSTSAQASERIAAACEAAHALDFPFTVTARAENLIRGNPDLDDTIARLLAYEQAGATCSSRRASATGPDSRGLRGDVEARQRARTTRS